LPEILAANGFEIRPWHEHFPGWADIDFLPRIAAEGWILLTKDKNIRRRPIEVETILNSEVRAFVLTASNLRSDEMAALLIRARRKIERICQQRGPFIFNITSMGNVAQVPKRAFRRRVGR
jgi:PIN domain-containing protein